MAGPAQTTDALQGACALLCSVVASEPRGLQPAGARRRAARRTLLVPCGRCCRMQAPFAFEPLGSQDLVALAAAEAAALAQRVAPPPPKVARYEETGACAAEANAALPPREPLRAMQPAEQQRDVQPAEQQRDAQPAEAAHAPRPAPEPAAPPLPPYKYAGRVQVASTAAEVDAAVAAVYAGHHAVVGWDIEWRVSFQRGAEPEKTALMQLALPGGAAGPPCVHLLRICLSGVTPALAALLADAAVIKAGCAARNDAHKVGRDFALRMDGVVDLSELAGTRLLPSQRWSLAALVARTLGCALPKPASLRTGAWDARELSAEQMSYAALDAWASLRVHVALSQLPELPPPPPSNLPPLQPLGAGAGGVTFVPALPALAALAPAKQAVLAQHCAGASVEQIVAQRGIKASTVENYLCDAMSAGHAYHWHMLGVDDATMALVDAALAEHAAGGGLAEAAPPDAAAAAGAAPLSAAAAAEVAARGRLKALKARLPDAISFSAIRLVIAHRERQAALAALPPPDDAARDA